MNKHAYIFYLSLLIVGFLVAYLSGLKLGVSNSNGINNDKTVNVSPEIESNISVTEGYWVKSNDNKILVYKSDGNTIIAETDIDISECSEQEKKILENGVYLENAEKLFKYLEANTS